MPQTSKSKTDTLQVESSKKSRSRRSSTASTKLPDVPSKPDQVEKRKSGENMMNPENMKGRRSVNCISMNLDGKHALVGNIPQYKINHITSFLDSEPDIIFLQDSLNGDVMKELLAKTPNTYDLEFQHIKKKKNSEEDISPLPPLTALAWDSSKYFGTPLQLTDSRLGDLAAWVEASNITVVKLDSKTKIGPFEDVYPSFIAISWHGKSFETPLRERTEKCTEFLKFLTTLRKNNMNIPLLVGGDFNLDLNSFEPFQDNSSLIRVHRPNGEQGRKDLNNAFVYTIDSIQITNTQTKQFHPDVFSSPWIVVTVKGRTQIKLWAVVKLQRFVRRYMRRMKKRKEGRIKMMETRERWKKKIEGPNYKPPPPPPVEPIHTGKSSGNESAGSDAPAYGGHRRQRFDDLKSVQERRQDEAQIENWLNYKP